MPLIKFNTFHDKNLEKIREGSYLNIIKAMENSQSHYAKWGKTKVFPLR
jgi:hypothetical protein